MSWEGKDRRNQAMQMNQEDRDRFIRMDTNLENLALVMSKHVIDDEKAFKKHGEDIDWLKKVTYIGMGALFILNSLPHLENILKAVAPQ